MAMLTDTLLRSLGVGRMLESLIACFEAGVPLSRMFFVRLGLSSEADAQTLFDTLLSVPQELTYAQLNICDGVYLANAKAHSLGLVDWCTQE